MSPKSAKSFTMIVEEEPRMELVIACDRDEVPKLLVYQESYFVKSGKYLTPGDRYRFFRVTPYQIG